MESVGQIRHVRIVDTGDAHAAILGHVDVELVLHAIDLSLSETTVGEHANLAGDVAPILGATSLLQVLNESLAHQVHAIGHTLHILLPDYEKIDKR